MDPGISPRRAILLTLGLSTALLGACSGSDTDIAQCPVVGSPLVSAHRGGAAYAPENTLMAFENAVRLGVDELELDTQLSADGQLVVMHDDSVDRTTDCSGAVQQLSLQQLQQCDAAYWFSPGQATTRIDETRAHPLRGKGIRIPSLDQVLDWYQTLPCPPRLSIEIKNIPGEANFDLVGGQTANVLVPMLQQRGLIENTVVQSFWPLTLTAVRQREPALQTQFLTLSDIAEPAILNLSLVIAGGHSISAPNFDAPDFNRALVALAHAANKAVIPYTVDRREDLDAVIAMGVDGVITNFPGCALQQSGRATPAKLTPDGVPDTAICR
jgi:glycerophosphoryl diester phosphodiesterase